MKKLIAFILLTLSMISCSQTNGKLNNNRILFIVSNAHFYGDSELETSNHFAEIVLAYDEFIKAGYSVDFVSPKGGAIPIGYISTSNETQKQYLYDSEFMNILKHTKSPEDINPSDYRAVYYGGGGAAMFGVPENKGIQDIAMHIYEEQNGIVSAICHGSAGLVNLKTKDGNFLVNGKKVNGFPDKFERMDAKYYATFPFSIERALINNGGDFKYSEEGWDDFSIVDGRLITGQDPTAARSVAKKVITTLQQL